MAEFHSSIFEQRFLKSFDATEIGYQVAGRGKKTIVLCNGLGGTATAWKSLVERFSKKYRFITWDYRGLFTSSAPKDLSTLSIPHHARDLEMILKKEKVKTALIGGWSMGVQVSLEYYREHASQFKGIFLLNGTYGYPFDTALKSPLSRYVIPVVNNLVHDLMERVQDSVKPIAGRIIDSKGFLKLIAKTGFVHENVDSEIFQELAREMIGTDLAMYHKIVGKLGEHSAKDVLETIGVPALVIAGDRDIVTPSSTAETMAHLIKDAQFFICPHGSHYSLLEFPDVIGLRLQTFLDDHYPA